MGGMRSLVTWDPPGRWVGPTGSTYVAPMPMPGSSVPRRAGSADPAGAARDKDGAVTDTSTCAPLDPDVAAVLAALPIDIGALLGGLSDDTIADARAAMGQMPVPSLTDKV